MEAFSKPGSQPCQLASPCHPADPEKWGQGRLLCCSDMAQEPCCCFDIFPPRSAVLWSAQSNEGENRLWQDSCSLALMVECCPPFLPTPILVSLEECKGQGDSPAGENKGGSHHRTDGQVEALLGLEPTLAGCGSCCFSAAANCQLRAYLLPR